MEIKLSSRKHQIIEEATALFREKGYAATSMRDLAQAVGMEAASLYSHFQGKEVLLQQICFDVANAFFEAMANIEKMPKSAAERLQEAIFQHVLIITKNPKASGVFQHDWRYLSEPALSQFIAMRNRYESFWVAIIEEGVASGHFQVKDGKLTVRILLSSLNWIYEWYRPNGNYTPQQLADKLTYQTLNGIKTNKQ